MTTEDPRKVEAKARLVRLLQGAYSGELAAAHAYHGHGKSVRDETERREIAAIRAEELEHRERVGEMLAEMGSGPLAWRELVFTLIGRTIGILCCLGGWFVPMYGAGKLERSNIVEYEHAARHARDAGLHHFIDDLLTMAEKEWDHELYFRTKAASSFLWRFFPKWPLPPPRAAIRESMAAENGVGPRHQYGVS